jgi:hypothetical protein
MMHEKGESIGLIYQNQFYEILINKNPTTFMESIKPMDARLPKELTFSNEDEKKLVIVTLENAALGIQPLVKEKSNQLPDTAMELLLKHMEQFSSSFLPSIVGGSVNLGNTENSEIETQPPIN